MSRDLFRDEIDYKGPKFLKAFKDSGLISNTLQSWYFSSS